MYIPEITAESFKSNHLTQIEDALTTVIEGRRLDQRLAGLYPHLAKLFAMKNVEEATWTPEAYHAFRYQTVALGFGIELAGEEIPFQVKALGPVLSREKLFLGVVDRFAVPYFLHAAFKTERGLLHADVLKDMDLLSTVRAYEADPAIGGFQDRSAFDAWLIQHMLRWSINPDYELRRNSAAHWKTFTYYDEVLGEKGKKVHPPDSEI